MANKDFDVIAKEQFKFLESDFGFQLSKSEKKDWGYELIYPVVGALFSPRLCGTPTAMYIAGK